MPKHYVSEDNHELVVRLRETGAGWMEIERRTRVPRRTAQRVFEEWRASKRQEGQRQARLQVASREFERHVQELVKLAERIVTEFELPAPRDHRNADDILNVLLDVDLRATDSSELGRLTPGDAARVRRRNRLLLQSLKVHTEKGVDWDDYDAWLAARQEWAQSRKRIEEHGEATLRNVVRDEKCEVGVILLQDEGATSHVVAGLMTALLSAVLDDSTTEVGAYVGVQQSRNGAFLSFGRGRDSVEHKLQSPEEAAALERCCRRILDTLSSGHDSVMVERLRKKYDIMTATHERLSDALQELRLVPLILATECEFCPA